MTCKRQDLTRKQTISGIRLPFLLVKTVKHEQFYNDLKYYLQERELNAKNLLVNRAEKPDRREAAPDAEEQCFYPTQRLEGAFLPFIAHPHPTQSSGYPAVSFPGLWEHTGHCTSKLSPYYLHLIKIRRLSPDISSNFLI